jgi:hypothetical protein
MKSESKRPKMWRGGMREVEVARSDLGRKSTLTGDRGGGAVGDSFVNDGLNVYPPQLRPHPISILSRGLAHKTDDSIGNIAPNLEDLSTFRSIESKNAILNLIIYSNPK